MSNTIVDVRTAEEFSMGHVEGSINIPLDQLQNRLAEIKALDKPLTLCCASGNRSGRAMLYLKSMGIECQNGGSWMDVL